MENIEHGLIIWIIPFFKEELVKDSQLSPFSVFYKLTATSTGGKHIPEADNAAAMGAVVSDCNIYLLLLLPFSVVY